MFDIVLTNKQVRITMPESTFTSDTPQGIVERAKAFMEHAGLVPFEATVDENFKPNKAARRGEVSCVFNYTIEFKPSNTESFNLLRPVSVEDEYKNWRIQCLKGSVLIVNKRKLTPELGIIKGVYANTDYTITFNKSIMTYVMRQINHCRREKYGDLEMNLISNALIMKETDVLDGAPVSSIEFKARPVFVEFGDRLFLRSGGPALDKGSLVIVYEGRRYTVGNAHDEIMWIKKDETNASITDIKAETMFDVINYTAALVPINAIAVNFVAPGDVNDWFLLEQRSGITEAEAHERYREAALADSVSAYVVCTRNITSTELHAKVDDIVKAETTDKIYQRYMRDAVTTDLTGVPMSSVNRPVRQPTLEPARGIPSPAAIFDATAHYIQTGRYKNIGEMFVDIFDGLSCKREWGRYATYADLVNVSELFGNYAKQVKPVNVERVVVLADVMIDTIRDIVNTTPVASLRSRINVGECIDILTDIDKHIRSEVIKSPIVW